MKLSNCMYTLFYMFMIMAAAMINRNLKTFSKLVKYFSRYDFFQIMGLSYTLTINQKIYQNNWGIFN